MNSFARVSALLLSALLTAIAADAPAKPPVVDKFLNLFEELRTSGSVRQSGQSPRVSFQLTESEIDDYMRYSLKTAPRPGLDSVTVKIFPNNYISTYSVIDFDAVERWKPGTIPGILRPVLSGRKSIWVDYRFHVQGAKATFSVEKAYYQNVRLPAFVVEKTIEIVAAKQPEKYDTSKPVTLPFGLRQLSTVDHTVMGQN